MTTRWENGQSFRPPTRVQSPESDPPQPNNSRKQRKTNNKQQHNDDNKPLL
eukprot:CAMPEP_0195028158 /NCGR_PEP_ID=MMETSP0326_2-20130528/53825_1 /TAXON_ID=2866 ORGANISM="Crypthecodinium cohnii, Strain Seligo" /NCGR_SAMPLE_ID=MMETSP0326_2 /ASSEMBLY_ACC=CAM_ASM_000348 /LENGTH=50 /DNA_ID=CAMNT_0040050583 /DNA_START=18 /DNA_END=167 /DNA_ORIENTATION=-